MQNSEVLFRDKPIWQAIFSLVGPSILSVLVMVIYNMTDLFFINLLQDTAQTAAVSVVSPVFTLASAGATVLGMGGCAAAASSLGAGDKQDVRTVSSLCGWCAILVGAVLAVVLNLGCAPLLGMLGANAEILPHAAAYLRILALGAPAMILSVSAATLLRADGAIRRGLVGNLAGSVTNMVLDPLFILVFGWGIAGAAAATVLGNLVACAIYLDYILRRSQALRAAADKATMVVSLVQMGICMGVQPLLAYNAGARNLPRLRGVLTRLAGLTFGVGAAFAATCLLGQNALLGLFLSDAEALALGRKLLPWLLAASPLLGLYYLSTNFLQAAGRAAGATVLSALRQGLLLIPALYLLHALLGLPGLAAARAAADLTSVAIAMALFLRTWRDFVRLA